jgi:hypothetical protein
VDECKPLAGGAAHPLGVLRVGPAAPRPALAPAGWWRVRCVALAVRPRVVSGAGGTVRDVCVFVYRTRMSF